MLRRLARQFGLLITAMMLATCATAAEPAPKAHRVVAIGDLHGDFGAWRDIAVAAQLVDAKGRWVGRDTVLVQTGDVVDRGPDSLKIVQDLMRLQREAPKAGGQVIAMVGNHEAMNVTDDLRYVSAGDYGAFTDRNSEALRDKVYASNKTVIEAAYHKQDAAMTPEAIKAAWIATTPLGMIEHQAAWHPDGKIGRWVVSNPAVVLLDGTLFVHGGISAAYAKLPLADINAQVAKALTAREMAPTSIINDEAGPLWYRGLVSRDPPAPTTEPPPASTAGPPPTPAPPAPPALTIDQELDQVLAAYGAKRMVIGHTPILSGISITHDGKLVRIDTGISEYYGGKLSWLEIVGDTVTPHVTARTAPAKGAGQ